jgi:uncharacterized protein DUF5677
VTAADDTNDLRQRLVAAEADVLKLARALDRPVRDEEYTLTQLALAARSRSLLAGFIALADGAEPIAAFALLRPMVEINILMRFLTKNPELHLELWHAEGERNVLAMVDEHDANEALRDRWGQSPLTTVERAARRNTVAAARQQAQAAGVVGVGKSGSVLPTTKAQLAAINEPGANEAYTFAYRALSPDPHAGARAVLRGRLDRPGDGTASYRDDVSADDVLPARALALTTFASTLAIASDVLGLGIEVAANEIKHRFVPLTREG